MDKFAPLQPVACKGFSFDRNLRSEDGFTLIELIFVVMIVAILCGLAIPGYHEIIKSVIISDCSQQLSAYNKAVIGYYNTYNELPLNIGTLENHGLVTVLACPKDSPSDCASHPLSKPPQGKLVVEATSTLIGLHLVVTALFSIAVVTVIIRSFGQARTTIALTETGLLALVLMLKQELLSLLNTNMSSLRPIKLQALFAD